MGTRNGKTAVKFAAMTLALAISLPGVAAAEAGSSKSVELVPVRVLAETLGMKVTWNEENREVLLAGQAGTLLLKIGDRKAVVNGVSVDLDAPISLVNERTMAPLQLLNETFRLAASWDQAAEAVRLKEDDWSGRAAQLVHHMYGSGTTSEAFAGFSEVLGEAIPPAALESYGAQAKAMLGALGKRISTEVTENGVHKNVVMVYEAERMPIEITVRFDKQGSVDDFALSPFAAAVAHPKPDYDKAGTYTEQEVVIGSGSFALPGTLTMPVGEGPFPAVVLIHGSGPHDRDSTIGGAKPFKDLAAGLAGQGIAVLRYEKITKIHTAKVSANPHFTLRDETVKDGLLAVDLLRSTQGINPSQIYVAGHSQGGFAVPLILEEDVDQSIAGALLLSAPSGRFTDILVEQQKEALERLKQLGVSQDLIGQQEQAAAMWKGIADMVNDPQYSKDNLPPQFPLGGAYWWLEQRDYVASEKLKSNRSLPLFIAQGENDWQVPMSQLRGWKTALAGRTNVEFKSYPRMNHILAEYNGISVGMEYMMPSNVAPALIDDLAAWVKKAASSK